MHELIIKTKKSKEVVDITDKVNGALSEERREGLVNLFVTHTTAALTVADLDQGTDLDMLEALEVMCPKLDYRHAHNPEHTPDHIMSALIGVQLALPFNQNGLILGTWQRVILIELDGPRDRRIIITII